MSRILSLFLLIATVLMPVLSFAHENSPHEESGEATMENRLRSLEENQAELYHTLAEKKAAGLASPITERLTLSGLLEVAATAENLELAGSDSEAASDLTVATVQLGFGVKFTEEIRGNFSLLYEEDATDLEVDEAAIDLNYAPLFARLGQLYVPFGVYPSHFISDPLTLELGETRETALLLGYGHDLFSLSAFVFNGDAKQDAEEDHFRDWGASLVFIPAEGVELGGSYLSDLADSDADLAAAYQRRVGGWSAFVLLERGPFGLSGEMLGAVRSFAPADLDADGDGTGDQPLAWNVEVSWALLEDVELAARYEGSSEFAGQPERQYGLNASWGMRENVTLSLEYLRGHYEEEFGRDDDDRILDRRDLVTAQVSLEF